MSSALEIDTCHRLVPLVTQQVPLCLSASSYSHCYI